MQAMTKMDYRTARAYMDRLESTDPARHAALETLRAAIESEREWADDYYNTNDESPLAEYVAGAGYGGDMAHEIEDRVRDNRDQWSDEVCEWITAQLAAPSLGDLLQFTELKSAGIYVTSNELCSAAVGECEHQLSDEIQAQLAALTDEERAAVCELESVRDDVIYVGDDYTRWVLTLDVERLEEHLAETTEA